MIPGNADFLLQRAETYMALEKYEDAISDFQSVARYDPSADVRKQIRAAQKGLKKQEKNTAVK
jgi:tetratricopeptide (TPR) repeat protein